MLPDCIPCDKTSFPPLQTADSAPDGDLRRERTPGARRIVMKLFLDNPAGRNLVTGYGADYIAINHHHHRSGLIVLPDRLIEPWGELGFDRLGEADFTVLSALAPEIVLLGTGARQRFPAPALLRPLIDANIGHEVMGLAAACQTYNILMAEGRRVTAALLLDV